MKKRIFLRIEEVILIFLILLNLFDFAEKLTPEFDYIKKVISFILMFYLIYRVSLSKQIFGTKNSDFDFLVVFAMFSLIIVRNLVSIGKNMEESFFTPFFDLIINNAFVFESTSLYVGTLLLLGLSFYSAANIPIKTPSLMSVLKSKNTERILVKVFTIYLVFLAFFLFFFNLFFEWLTIAIDAPLISLGLIFYLFLSIKKHHFDTESTLFKVGNFADEFIEGFVKHFKYKEKLILGLVGMLVLHLITDVLVFLIPMITGVHDPLYSSILFDNKTLLQLANQAGNGQGQIILYFLQYLLSAVGLLFLMIMPAIVWFAAYFNKKLYDSRVFYSLFYASLTSLLITPIFFIFPLQKEFYGVGISNAARLVNVNVSLTLFILSFIIVLIIYKKLNNLLMYGAVFISSIFFCWYIINYFLSAATYYVFSTIFLAVNNFYYLAFHFFIFFMLILIFYLVGFWLYLRTVIKKVTIKECIHKV